MPSFKTTSLALMAAATTALAQNSTVRCSEGLHVILARGTTEEIPGVQGAIGEALQEAIPGTSVYNLPYPATETDPFYFESVFNGTVLLRAAITEYIEACPDSKIAVLGYSQGAQLATNSFCGTHDLWVLGQGPTEPLAKEDVEDNVIAIVAFGDPSHRYNSFSRGTATGNGAFYRDSTKACEAYGDAIVAYCDQGDPFCDVTTPFNPAAHLSYVDRYSEEVVEWIVQRYTTGEGQVPGSGGSPSSSASASVTPTGDSSEPTDEPAGAAAKWPGLAMVGSMAAAAVSLM